MMHLTYYDVYEREDEERKLMFCLKVGEDDRWGREGSKHSVPQSELGYERSARERPIGLYSHLAPLVIINRLLDTGL